MATFAPLSPSDIAHRGEMLYNQLLKQYVEPEHVGKFLVVDVETGDYEIGTDYILPTEHLLAKRPDAPLYALRVGYRSVGRIRGRYTSALLRAKHASLPGFSTTPAPNFSIVLD